MAMARRRFRIGFCRAKATAATRTNLVVSDLEEAVYYCYYEYYNYLRIDLWYSYVKVHFWQRWERIR
jgi:hypothetical protein